MSLLEKDRVVQDEKGRRYRIVGELSAGSQGEVARAVDESGREWAIKLYFASHATTAQRQIVRELVGRHSGHGLFDRRLVWPRATIELKQGDDVGFGFVMELVDRSRFKRLGEILNSDDAYPSVDVLTQVSTELCALLLDLSTAGFSYGDISNNNILIDPISAAVKVIDCDNIGFIGRPKQVVGTDPYAPPEILGEGFIPNAESDLHAFAVFLFELWCWQHPLEGRRVVEMMFLDEEARRDLYQANPVFIFDPDNRANDLPEEGPHREAYLGIRQRWEECPRALRGMFLRAFTKGLRDPGERPRLPEWLDLFRTLRDSILSCVSCSEWVFWEGGDICPSCGGVLGVPLRLVSEINGRRHAQVLLLVGTKILDRHCALTRKDGDREIGEVCEHARDRGKWMIRNLSKSDWQVSIGDGGKWAKLPAGKGVVLRAGLRLKMSDATCVVEE